MIGRATLGKNEAALELSLSIFNSGLVLLETFLAPNPYFEFMKNSKDLPYRLTSRWLVEVIGLCGVYIFIN